MTNEQLKKEQRMLLIKWVLRGLSLASVSYLGYNLFTGEVMTTIDNLVATGTFTLAQVSSALILILTKVLPQSMSLQTSQALTPIITQDNTQIRNELIEVRKENAEILALLKEQKEYRDNVLKEEA